MNRFIFHIVSHVNQRHLHCVRRYAQNPHHHSHRHRPKAIQPVCQRLQSKRLILLAPGPSIRWPMISSLHNTFEARLFKPLLIISRAQPVTANLLSAFNQRNVPTLQRRTFLSTVDGMRLEIDFLHLKPAARNERIISLLEYCR
jgi:hypothetical protein